MLKTRMILIATSPNPVRSLSANLGVRTPVVHAHLSHDKDVITQNQMYIYNKIVRT
jgi:hypothetical protein